MGPLGVYVREDIELEIEYRRYVRWRSSMMIARHYFLVPGALV